MSPFRNDLHAAHERIAANPSAYVYTRPYVGVFVATEQRSPNYYRVKDGKVVQWSEL